MGCHRLGNKRHLAQHGLQALAQKELALRGCCLQLALIQSEHVGGMDIADDVVDVIFKDNNLALTTLCELLAQLVQRAMVFDGNDFRSRHHTVAHLRIGEVKSILEDFHLFFYIFIATGIVDGRLYEIIQIDFRKGSIVFLLIHLDADHAQQATRKECGKAADGPQYDIEDISQRRKESQHPVGVALEERLRQELTREQDDNGRADGVEQDASSVVEHSKQGIVEQGGKENAIDHQHDVVAHQHSGDKHVGVVVELRQAPLCQTVLLLIHLHQQPVARNESYLHT